MEITGVKKLFSKSARKKWDWLADRPEGEIELLIGSEMAGLHPDTLEKVGDLKIMKSQFGHGFLMTGRHPSISVEGVYWPENVSVGQVQAQGDRVYSEQADGHHLPAQGLLCWGAVGGLLP